MTRSHYLSIVLGTLMVIAAGLTKIITPDIFLSAIRPPMNLDTVIPAQFDDWKEEKNFTVGIINPQTQQILEKLYTQTLSRTYINDKGQRVMLSIAYGADQRDANAVHYPEVCYPAQGFQVQSNNRSLISTLHGTIPVKRLETNITNQRYEPVTYWATVGDVVINGPINKKIIEMQYGLKRQVPDGIIFRVSSLDVDTKRAFSIQDSFVNSLINNLSLGEKKWIAGLN